MARIAEGEKVLQVYRLLQELCGSEVPVVRDDAVQMLAICRQLVTAVEPEHFGHIVDFE